MAENSKVSPFLLAGRVALKIQQGRRSTIQESVFWGGWGGGLLVAVCVL